MLNEVQHLLSTKYLTSLTPHSYPLGRLSPLTDDESDTSKLTCPRSYSQWMAQILSCGNDRIKLFWKLWAHAQKGVMKEWRHGDLFEAFSGMRDQDLGEISVPALGSHFFVPQESCLLNFCFIVGWIGWKRERKVKSVVKGMSLYYCIQIYYPLLALELLLSYPWIR